MDIRKIIEDSSFDYDFVYSFFAEHSNNDFLINMLKSETKANRLILKRNLLLLLEQHGELSITPPVVKRVRELREVKSFSTAPEEIQQLVEEKNREYRALSDYFSQLKALAFTKIQRPNGTIAFAEALSLMDSITAKGEANLFSFDYVDGKGDVKQYSLVRLNKLSGKIRRSARSKKSFTQKLKTKYWKQTNRRMYNPENGQVFTVRINQIITFNGLEVVWM